MSSRRSYKTGPSGADGPWEFSKIGKPKGVIDTKQCIEVMDFGQCVRWARQASQSGA